MVVKSNEGVPLLTLGALLLALPLVQVVEQDAEVLKLDQADQGILKPIAKQEMWPSNPNKDHQSAFCVLKKQGCIGTVLVFLIFIITTIILAVCYGQNKSRSCDEIPLPCPPDWIWYQGRCYYFSKEEGNWSFCQKFCSLHDASLATLTNEEKDFIRLLKGREAFWIGLRRSQGQSWKWLDGDIATLEILGDGGDCAYLNNEFQASSSRCRTTLFWLCSKPAASKKAEEKTIL